MRAHAIERMSPIVGALLALTAAACGKDQQATTSTDASSASSGGSHSGSSGGSQNGSSGGAQSGGSGGSKTGGSGGAQSGGGGGSAGTPQTDAASSGGAATGSDGAPGGRNFTSDRGAFFGASRCAQANVQLCEDFESGTLDTATWKVSGDVPVIDGTETARGTKALHIVKNGNGQSYIRETKTFPEPKNTYYGRIFVYFNSLPADPMTYAHWTIIGAVGTNVSGEIRVSGQLQNNANHFGVGTDNRTDANGTGDWTNSDKDPNNMPLAVPTKSWLCLEWMHKGDTNETRFWWDAVEHPSLYTMPTTPHGGNPANPYILPAFTSVWVGWQEYQTSTQVYEMWVDEVAIDQERIGCVL